MELDYQEAGKEDFNQKSSQLNYDEEDEENLSPQSQHYQNQQEQRPQIQLENSIMEKISSLEKEDDLISKELQVKLQRLLEEIMFSNLNEEQKLKRRMHELALSKILVNTHGKTQFYLVKAHHHLGEAYLNYKCYQQALDHLTMALKKNAKINDMNEIKLYHSYVLTTYSRCYYEISSYDDALQILKKAHDIQVGCETQNLEISNVQTLKLISNCYFKMKNYSEALVYIQKVLTILENKKGKDSKQVIRTNIEKAKILINEQKTQKQAIETLQGAIHSLEQAKHGSSLQIADYFQLLASFHEKTKNHIKQIEFLRKKLEIYIEKFEEGHEKTLKVKKNIAILLQKYNRIPEAIKELHQILEFQEKLYPQNRLQMGKTLKALGLCYISQDNRLNEAEQYLKRAQKLLSDHGVGKSLKQIKSRLQQIKSKKESNEQKEEFRIIQRQIHHQPIGIAH